MKHVIKKYKELAEKIALVATPLVDLSNLPHNPNVKILAKDESQNLTGSTKVRPALFNLVNLLVNQRATNPVDSSSGNYAISLVYLAKKLGFCNTTIFIPESFALYFLKYLRDNGIDDDWLKVFYKGIRNSDEARKRALEYSERIGAVYLDQYNNPCNSLSHYHFTAGEIVSDVERLQLKPTHFISSIGSGGTLTGIGTRLKERYGAKVIGIQLSEKTIQGATRDIRDKTNLPRAYSDLEANVDFLMDINTGEVFRFEERLRNSNIAGIDWNSICGSSFVNLYAAVRLSEEIPSGVIVTIIPALKRG